MTLHRLLRSTRALRLAALVAALGILVAIAASRTAVQADKPQGWQIGDPMTTVLPIAGGEAETVAGRIAELAVGLGLPGSPAPALRQHDAWLQRDFDEVVLSAADGTHTADVMTDPATGIPFMIARFDRPPGYDTPTLNANAAVAPARMFAAALGVAVPNSAPRVTFYDAMGDWEVSWDRVIDGVVAPGFEITIGVYPGGQFAGLSAPLAVTAPRPATLIGNARAAAIGLQWAVDNGMAKRAKFRMNRPELEWRQANNYWDPSGPDAPDPVLRLSYRIQFSYDIGDPHPQLVQLVIDAGDGSVIAGAMSS